MTHNRWIAPDMRLWQGRSDAAEQGDTRRLFDIIKPALPFEDDALPPGTRALLGFACDAGVTRNQGRPGADRGPEIIRRFLANLPAHELTGLVDAGDITCNDGDLEKTQEQQSLAVESLLRKGGFPLVLGGGHEIAWGTWRGLRRHLDTKNDTGAVLIINLDAHFDLRSSRPGSSGTPFDQIATATQEAGLPFGYACLGISRLGNTAALFSRADELGVTVIEDIDLQEPHLGSARQTMDKLIEAADHIYLSVDLDVLPAAVMPAVSAPAAYGVPISVIEALVIQARDSGKLRVADIAEFNPRLDHDDHGARVAARLAYRLLEQPSL